MHFLTADTKRQAACQKLKVSSCFHSDQRFVQRINYMRYSLLLLSILSFSGFAEEANWLCIGEHGAQVTKINNDLESNHFTNKDKWLITSEGLKYFGTDLIKFDNCNRDEKGRPYWCDRSDGLWGGNFIMDENNVFALSLFNLDDENDKHFSWVIGRCSKL